MSLPANSLSHKTIVVTLDVTAIADDGGLVSAVLRPIEGSEQVARLSSVSPAGHPT
jgi:hypothetical protein